MLADLPRQFRYDHHVAERLSPPDQTANAEVFSNISFNGVNQKKACPPVGKVYHRYEVLND